jgi:type IV secretory pathway VirB2 component (pilin)
MFPSLLVTFLAFLVKILGVFTGLFAGYKTEAIFAIVVGLSLVLAGNQFDRCLILVSLFCAFLEGLKIGEHPLV